MRTLRSLSVILLLASSPFTAAQAEDAADATAVKSVLSSYKSALERQDLTGVEQLFAAVNEVIESGKIEGTYANYRDHHIGPELGHFKSFKFFDYIVNVRLEGELALATETYRYKIELKDKPEAIERTGAASSVLKKIDGQWRILSMHNSSRTPKPPVKP